MLIHLVGDLHQPLHVATKFDHRFPKGDMNGLKYSLRSHYKNLHRYWDLGGGLLAYKKKKVYSGEGLLKSLLKKSPAKADELKAPVNDALNTWVNESFNLAKQHAYQQASSIPIKSSYRNKVQRISKQQLRNAGLHLAQLLNKVFK
tara:strand:- start:70 stop:507 length:438 start_codon:yes stop_codon:yes gene_type:complete